MKVSLVLWVGIGLLALSAASRWQAKWNYTENSWIENRDNDDKQISTALSREELIYLCEKLGQQSSRGGVLANRLREKGGLPKDTRWP